jgi:hypothetical protein
MYRQLVDKTSITQNILVFSAFIFAHGYTGIRHDGVYYLGDALNLISPQRMAGDIYFDSLQGHYTLLPWLYSQLIPLLGISMGAMLLVCATFAAYVLTAWYLLRSIVNGQSLAFGLLIVFIAMPVYGGHRIFGYAEPFLTGRSMAEPFCLLALALLLRKQVIAAALSLIVAALLHPLITLPALILAWLYLVQMDRRWLWSLLLLIPVGGLALNNVAPFDGLLKTYDLEWLAIIKDVNVHCFPLLWTVKDWSGLFFDLGLLGVIAFLSEEGNGRRLMKASVLLTLVSLVLSVTFADGLHNVLLTSLQLWRAQWITHWLALALSPWLFFKLWATSNETERAMALLLLLSVFTAQTYAPPIIILTLSGVMYWRDRVQLSRWIPYVIMVVVVLAMTIQAVQQWFVLKPAADHGTVRGTLHIAFTLLSITPITALIIGLGLYLLKRFPVPSAIMALLISAVAIGGWDQRSDGVRFREDFWGRPLWDKMIEPGARIYWYGDLGTPWMMMQRGSYFSENQGAPLLFNRQAALEYDSRQKLVGPVESQMQICGLINKLSRKDDCAPTTKAIQDLCMSASLDYMVFPVKLPLPLVSSVNGGLLNDNHEDRYFLYRCSDIAAADPDEGSSTAR